MRKKHPKMHIIYSLQKTPEQSYSILFFKKYDILCCLKKSSKTYHILYRLQRNLNCI